MVIAVLGALAAVGCPVRVTGLVAAAENAVGGDAMRPGDVVRHYGGRTSEVTNTDAEGRLVLADALAYAVDKLEPDGARRRRHPDRRDEGGARPAGRRLLRQRRGARRRGPRRRGGRRGSRCGGSRWTRTTRRSSTPRSPTPTTQRAVRARSPLRCSSSTSSATCRGPTWTSPRSATRPTTASSGATGPTGFGARALLALARPATTRWRGSGERPDRPLVARRRPRGGRGRARVVRRGHVARPVHRHGRAAVQDLAAAAGGVVRGLLRLRRPTRRARTFQETFTEAAAESPGSQIVGSAPVLIEDVRHRRGRRGRDGLRGGRSLLSRGY